MFGLAVHDDEARCSLLSVKRTEINDSVHRISVVDERSNLPRESGGREHGQSGGYKCLISKYPGQISDKSDKCCHTYSCNAAHDAYKLSLS